MVLLLQTGQGLTRKDIKDMMQHGETGAQLPRAVARQRGREVVQMHNGHTSRVWRGGNLFSVPHPDAIKGVVVEKKRIRVYQKPSQNNT
jgi:hypothetical protein